jgi:hypothetical protein
MQVIWIFGICILFLTSISLIIFANMLFYTILGEVNARRPSNEQISMLGVNVKFGRVLLLHSQFFPDSKKRGQLKLLLLVGFLVAGIAFLLYVLHYGRMTG